MSGGEGPNFIGQIPGFIPGDTVFYKVIVSTNLGKRILSTTLSYSIFKKQNGRLFIYNNNQYPLIKANEITNGKNPSFDTWSAPLDGITELDSILKYYTSIVLSDGSYPSRNVYPVIGRWLLSSTSYKPVTFFFNSQDYGCYITNNCSDTTFSATAWESKFLGIDKLGPQDIPPTTGEILIVPYADTVTNYLLKYNADSGTALWYYPSFELGFSGYADEFTKTSDAKTLFTHGSGSGIVGIKKITNSTRTIFLGFDASALQFRSDTSLAPAVDPKYRRIVDIGSLSLSFLTSLIPVYMNSQSGVIPVKFALGQNYPNPFNPSTTIEYNVPIRANVDISIYNILGQKIATIINTPHEPGSHKVSWNSPGVSSGIYFYRMLAGSFSATNRLVVLK